MGADDKQVLATSTKSHAWAVSWPGFGVKLLRPIYAGHL